MSDENLLLEFQTTRRLKPQTMKGYKDSIRIYKNFNDLTLEELIEEAMNEEKDRIAWVDRTLKRRLEEFRTYLYDTYSKKTAKMHFARIKTIYLHFYIEIHKLPEVQTDDKNPPITFKDLPTQTILRKALSISTPMMRSLQLMMVSSGLPKKEIRHLTFRDVIDATNEYHNETTLIGVINALKNREDIVPTFHVQRFKTGKWFYCFCTPEAFNALLDYIVILLNKHADINIDDPIFDINKDYFNNYFKEINETLGLGKVRNYNRYTSHMLRRYHASTLLNDGLDKDTVNTLQGKGQNPTDEAYFKINPKKLKEKYMQHMHCLYVDFDVKEIKPEEIVKLERDVREKEEIISKYNKIFSNIDERLKNLEGKNDVPLSGEEFEDLFS